MCYSAAMNERPEDLIEITNGTAPEPALDVEADLERSAELEDEAEDFAAKAKQK